MKEYGAAPITLSEGRFARFEAIKWWNQSRMLAARVLVIGAGALGNEVIKNLALLGIGHLIIVDRDHIEASNLSRSVLFRASDEGQPKALVAARRARDIYPEMHACAVSGDVLADVGLGCFRWADAVVGALDNREARVFVNHSCYSVGRPWIDGGIDVLSGIVRAFAPPTTACYECTMSKTDWDLLNKRLSCSLLARRAVQEGGTPTTPTTASIIGAMQAQEVVKMLHGLDSLAGAGFVIEGLKHSSYPVTYSVSADCPWHEPAPEIVAMEEFNSDTPMAQLGAWCEKRLGGLDALDVSRETVYDLRCPVCGTAHVVRKAAAHITVEEAVCPRDAAECVPGFVHSITPQSDLWALSPREIGLPAWDIVWARYGDSTIGVELAGDMHTLLETN